MCGLAGIFSLSGKPIENAASRILAMTNRLKHRGPDAQGTLVSDDGLLALGNTRLAITDPSAPIQLPLYSQDGSSAISFNGEIYNYEEIREQMKGKDLSFRHRTDTEVLVEGLRMYGDSFLSQLDGMWAFAFYDFKRSRLLLSRDLMGERHLFYRILDGELIFASEPLPILADRGKPETVDIAGFVTALRYNAAPPGRTLVDGIKRLLPGHNLIASAGQNCQEVRYRKLHPEKWFEFFDAKPDLDTVIDQFEDLMHTASARRIPLDVPFVSTLSGGLDSALVCTFASNFGRRRIPTLYGQSAESPSQNLPGELDEYAASVVTSEKLNTDHTRIFLNDNECVPVLKRLAANGFDGILDSGTAPFEMLAREVRRSEYKVMLISDGPDELSGGYPVDQRAWAFDRFRASSPVSYAFRKAISSSRTMRRILNRLGKSAWGIPPDFSYSPFHFLPQHQANGVDLLSGILEPQNVAATGGAFGLDDETYADIIPELEPTQRRALSYASRSLPDMFNLRTDKAFLREAVECRLPFQAPELAEFQIALPAPLRFDSGNQTKYLLRKIVERRISPEVASRSKHGFSAPLFQSPNVAKAFEFEDRIKSSSMFEDLPFRENSREKVSQSSYKKLHWPLYVMAETYDQLKTGRY